MPATSIFGLSGSIKIDPGNTRSDKHTFTFVNASPFDICDLNITTFDDDVYGATPEVMPDNVPAPTVPGCSIETFELEEITLPNGTKSVRVKAGSTKNLTKGTDWDRDNDTSQSDETRIVFKNGKCIKPGEGFSLNLFFDEELNGNEGLIIAPSRLVNGKHFTFGGSESETAKPFTIKDLLELIGKLAAAAPTGLLGSTGTSSGAGNESLASLRKSQDLGTYLAIKASLHPEYINTSVSGMRRLPLQAVRDISPEKLKSLASVGIITVADLIEDEDVRKAQYLYTLSRSGLRG